MAISLYDVTIPVMVRAFGSLSAILEKGREYADLEGIPHETLLQARLIADMGPLTSQIQRASDTAKGLAVRLGQVENVAMEDNETTFEDLQKRIAKTVAFIEQVGRDKIDGREDAQVILKLGGREIPFTGQSYVLTYALPNFFFHVTTAYALLRQHGVPIGKLDFLGAR